jgi:hypothetical protein
MAIGTLKIRTKEDWEQHKEVCPNMGTTLVGLNDEEQAVIAWVKAEGWNINDCSAHRSQTQFPEDCYICLTHTVGRHVDHVRLYYNTVDGTVTKRRVYTCCGSCDRTHRIVFNLTRRIPMIFAGLVLMNPFITFGVALIATMFHSVAIMVPFIALGLFSLVFFGLFGFAVRHTKPGVSQLEAVRVTSGTHAILTPMMVMVGVHAYEVKFRDGTIEDAYASRAGITAGTIWAGKFMMLEQWWIE